MKAKKSKPDDISSDSREIEPVQHVSVSISSQRHDDIIKCPLNTASNESLRKTKLQGTAVEFCELIHMDQFSDEGETCESTQATKHLICLQIHLRDCSTM